MEAIEHVLGEIREIKGRLDRLEFLMGLNPKPESGNLVDVLRVLRDRVDAIDEWRGVYVGVKRLICFLFGHKWEIGNRLGTFHCRRCNRMGIDARLIR